jgi:hypothetical protein
MIARTIAVDAIPALGHDEAMRLAEAEYDRLLTVVDRLRHEDWSRQTDCTAWDVKAMLGHVLGMLELQCDAEERMRQIKTAAEIAAQAGGLRLDAMTALQVREHASLTPDQLRQALHEAAPPLRSNVPLPTCRACQARQSGRSGICSTSSTPATPGYIASTSAVRSGAR